MKVIKPVCGGSYQTLMPRIGCKISLIAVLELVGFDKCVIVKNNILADPCL